MAEKARIDFEASDKTGAAFAAINGKLDAAAKGASALVARFGAITAVLGAATLAFSRLDSTVRTVAAFKELEESSGASIENISALDRLARRTGTSFDTLSALLLKFNQVLSADAKSPQADALRQIGLSAEELRRIDPAEALLKTTLALDKFADDGNKARLVQVLLGKSTKDVAGFLRDMAEQGKLTATVTREQVEASDKYAKNLARLSADADDAWRVISGRFAVAVNNLNDAMRQGGNDAETFGEMLQRLAVQVATFSPAVALFNSVKGRLSLKEEGDSAAEYETRIRALNVALAGTVRQEDRLALIAQREEYRKKLEGVPARLEAAARDAFRSSERQYKPSLEPLKDGTDTKDDPTAKRFQNQMAALERAVAQERELLGSRNRMLDSFNKQGLLSFDAYYEGRKNAADLALRAELQGIDQQVAALRRLQAAAEKQTDKTDAQGKIDALLADRNKVERAAAEEAQALEAQRKDSAADYARVLRLLNADVVELKGNLAEAAGIRFDEQNAELIRRATAEGNKQALDDLAVRRRAVVAQGELSKLDADARRIQEALRNEEERIALSRQLGAITELDALAQVGAARARSVEQLDAVATAYAKTTAVSGTTEQVLAAQRLRLELEALRLSADPLAAKLNTLFKDAAGDGLADFISGTKNAKDAFTDFANSISQQLSRLAAQSIAESIFKGGGGVGGLANGVASLFKYGGTSYNPSAPNYENSMDRQNEASSWIGLVGSLFGLASGGNVQAGDIREVNERDGPGELLHAGGRTYLMAARDAMVTPPMGGGAGTVRPLNVTNYFTLQQPADRRTQQQVAAEAYQGLVRANARNS